MILGSNLAVLKNCNFTYNQGNNVIAVNGYSANGGLGFLFNANSFVDIAYCTFSIYSAVGPVLPLPIRIRSVRVLIIIFKKKYDQ